MMNTKVNWGIAKVHLLSRKRQTIIAVLGVMFGISMFILMISFMNGTNQFLQDAMLASTPDIHLYNEIKTDYTSSVTDEYFKTDPNRLVIVHNPLPKNMNRNLKNKDALIADIRKNNAVAAVSPVLSIQVFFNYGPAQFNGIIDGVNIDEEKIVLNLPGKMLAGKPENLSGTNDGILLGQSLAEKLNAQPGDMVSAMTATGSTMRFRVVGIFQFGLGSVDNIKALANIASVQQLQGRSSDYITDIQVKLKDIHAAKTIAASFAKKYGYKADDWETANASILATVVARNVLTTVVSIAVLVVAGFGIYNIMNMTINSKLKDIAILKAEGFTGKDITNIFLSQSLLIGFVGALLGVVLGFVLSYIVSQIPFPKNELISIKYFQVSFELKYYILGVVFGVLTTFMAGVMPAAQASKLDPVAILRG